MSISSRRGRRRRAAADSESAEIVRAALEAPRDFPPLRQTVVPGDRVTIAFDPSIPEAGLVLEAIAGTLLEAGVEAEGLTVLLPQASPDELERSLPPGATVAVHDPDDRSQLALSRGDQGGAADLPEPAFDGRRPGDAGRPRGFRPDSGLLRALERAFSGSQRPRDDSGASQPAPARRRCPSRRTGLVRIARNHSR